MSSLVLVVDDDPTLRSVVKVYLTGMDVTILDAERAEQALQVLETAKVHLIIADVHMTGMDGISFVKRVREDARPAIAGLPILLLTGDKAGDIREKAKAAGASQFISKPVSAPVLRGAVEQLLGHRPR
jgi:two-component system chemotaxis response regulator CheY